MKAMKEALRELYNVMFSVALVEGILDSIILFLIVFLVLVVINVSWYWALIPFGIYGFLHVRKKIKDINLRVVEAKVPQLREQLRTAADNADKKSEIIDSLHIDVLAMMKHVYSSYFINFKKLMRQLFVVAALVFIVITVAALHVELFDFNEFVKNIELPSKSPVKGLETSLIEEDENATGIFGNKSIAELGTEELQLQINPLMSDIDLSDIKEPEEKEFKSAFPTEIEAVSDAAFDEKIPKEHQEIVKRYFQQIATQ